MVVHQRERRRLQALQHAPTRSSLLMVLVCLLLLLLPVSSFVVRFVQFLSSRTEPSTVATILLVHHSRNSWRRRQQQQQQQQQQKGDTRKQQQYAPPPTPPPSILSNTKLPHPTSDIPFNTQLSNLLKYQGGTAEQAEQELLQRIAQNATDYDTISFNIVLQAWAKERSIIAATRADDLLTQLHRHPTLHADTYSYSAVLHAYAKSGGKRAAALRAEALLQQLEQLVKVTTDNCHNAVMDCWSVSGDPDAGRRAQRILTMLEERGLATRISYNACLKAWARTPSSRSKSTTSSSATTKSTSSYNSSSASSSSSSSNHMRVKRQHGITNGAIQAQAILQRMQNHPRPECHPDKISYSTCIDAIGKCTTDVQWAAYQSQQLLQQMMDQGLRPDVITYSSVLYAYARAGMVSEAMDLMEQMEQDGESPNTTFLNTLIHLFAMTGKADAAEAILQSMMSNDMADKITYTAVISAHSQVGNATRALELLDELQSLYEQHRQNQQQSGNDERWLPNSRTFACVFHAMAKSKEHHHIHNIDPLLQRMHQLYLQTQSSELLPNALVYGPIFFILASSSSATSDLAATRATALLEEMESYGVQPDAAIYAKYINTITKNSNSNSNKQSLAGEEASASQMATHILQVVEQGYAAGNDRLKPTKLLYSAVLQAYAKSCSAQGAQLAEQLFQRTQALYQQQGKLYAKPTTLYYNAVMDAHARSGQGRDAALRAEELLLELETSCSSGDDDDLAVKTRSYNAVILAWKNSNATDAPQRVEALLKRMNDRYKAGNIDCRPDRVTINCIIATWAKSNQPGAQDRAETFLQFMETLYQAGDLTFKPDRYGFNSVLDAYANSGQALRAEALYERMKELYKAGDKDLEPDLVTFTALHNAWRNCNEDNADQKVKEYSRLIAERKRFDRSAAAAVPLSHVVVAPKKTLSKETHSLTDGKKPMVAAKQK